MEQANQIERVLMFSTSSGAALVLLDDGQEFKLVSHDLIPQKGDWVIDGELRRRGVHDFDD